MPPFKYSIKTDRVHNPPTLISISILRNRSNIYHLNSVLEKGGHVIVETDVNLANNRDAPVLCMDHNNRGVAMEL